MAKKTQATQERERPTSSRFVPLIGLILAGIAGGIAFFASEPTYEFLQANLLQGAALPDENIMRLIVGGAIFLILITLVALGVAAVTPRRGEQGPTERDLQSEKLEKERERQRAKRRKKTMRAKMREANKDISDL